MDYTNLIETGCLPGLLHGKLTLPLNSNFANEQIAMDEIPEAWHRRGHTV